MRIALAVAAVLALAVPIAAYAQAAIDPAAVVARYESSGCVNNQNTRSTASGCFGFTNSTWTQYAPQAGVSLSQCPTAASCPVSSQFAVFAADVNSHGLSDWTCPGCDAGVSNAVNSGQLPASGYNLSTNPQDYAALDNQQNLQAYFAGGSGVVAPAGSLTASQSVNPTSTTATAAAPTSATFSGSTLQPFSWLWNQYQSAVATPIQNQINYVQQQAAGQIDGLAILILIIAGYLLFYGNLSMREAWSKMLRFLFVLPLVTDPGVYNAWVVEPVNGIVTWLAQGLGVTGGASGPASLFDNVLQTYFSHVETAWAGTHGFGSDILNGLLILGSAIIIIGASVLLFAVWLIAQALIEVVLILGPILLLGLLFDYTRGLFDRWIGALILLGLVTFCADMLSALFLGVVTNAFNRIAPTNSALADCLNLLAVGIVIAVLAAVLVILPRLLEHMAAAAGAPAMSRMHQWMVSNVYQPARAGAARLAPRSRRSS